jgi:hypothetical protein
MKKGVIWFKGLSIAKKVLLGIVAIGILGAATGSSTPPTKVNLTSSQASIKTAQTQKKSPTITTKTETDTQAIPFTSNTAQTSTLPQGTTKVTTSGVNGSETLTYEITYTDGVQTNKTLTNTTVTTPPVNQVTSIGTYVAPAPAPAPSCPNGTYVNSAGNTVCSPYSSPSAPSGATAQCVDGTYSFSQSHSGTCSHHGGVAQWL